MKQNAYNNTVEHDTYNQPCVTPVQVNQVCWQRKFDGDNVSRPVVHTTKIDALERPAKGTNNPLAQRNLSRTRRLDEARHMSDDIIQMKRAR